MKITSKVLFVGITVLSFYSYPVLSMEEGSHNDQAARVHYKLIFDKGFPTPDPEDPYQERPTSLSESFLKDHPSYEFPTDGEHVVQLGNFQFGNYRVDTKMPLGRGDDGVCYLGRHIETGTYVAAKNRYMDFGKEDMHEEYKRLNALGRLYSVWSKEDTSTPNAFLIIPFVDGKPLTNYFSVQPWITTTIDGNKLRFSDLNAGVNLIGSMLNQLNYLAKKGILHDDASCNILVSNDHKRVVLIDFGWTGDLSNSSGTTYTSLDRLKFDARKYANHSFYFLGLTPFLHRGVDNNITEPQNVVDYLNTMPRVKEFNLKQFNEAFQKLKGTIEKVE